MARLVSNTPRRRVEWSPGSCRSGIAHRSSGLIVSLLLVRSVEAAADLLQPASAHCESDAEASDEWALVDRATHLMTRSPPVVLVVPEL